jgi:hypothetical protein
MKMYASEILRSYCIYRNYRATHDEALAFSFLDHTSPGAVRNQLWDILIGTPIPPTLDK